MGGKIDDRGDMATIEFEKKKQFKKKI